MIRQSFSFLFFLSSILENNTACFVFILLSRPFFSQKETDIKVIVAFIIIHKGTG